MIYLHETIRIVGAGATPYMDVTADWSRLREESGEPVSRLVGTWATVGSTGNWPEVINLWEMDGFEHWGTILDRAYVHRAEDKQLGDWWKKALEHRSGGYDRILEPAPFSPTRAQLLAAGVHGEIYIHEVTQVKPGKAPAYLRAIEEHWLPLAQRHGLVLVGAFEVIMRDTEVITFWACKDVASFVRYASAARTDREILAWRERAREHCDRFTEHLMVAAKRSPLGP
jgi:hypothetical protein